jgi:hypothetical protein
MLNLERLVMLSWIGLAVLLVGACAGGEPPDQVIAKGIDPSNPECPLVWEFANARTDELLPANPSFSPLSVDGELPQSGPVTNIPEFNDCQRFINEDGSYGGLYGIFLSAHEMSEDRFRPFDEVDSARAGTYITEHGTAVATIFAYDSPYQTLGIELGANCLYVIQFVGNHWGAVMVPVDAPADCEVARDQTQTRAVKVLDVRRKRVPNASPDDYPMAARWESYRPGQYAAGLPCGNAWCDVGKDLTGVSDGYTVPGPNKMRFAVKGWFDEQYLASPSVTTSGMTVQPSRLRGIIVPEPDLSEWNSARVQGQWNAAATVFLSETSTLYRDKLGFEGVNFENGQPERGNRIEFCRGNAKECTLPDSIVARLVAGGMIISDPDTLSWWAKIIPPSGSITYRPISRCGHEGIIANFPFGVSATARWHWKAQDEVTWTRCLEGCCEVHPWDN